LGPICGGLGFEAASPSTGGVAVSLGVAPPSSAALITSLELVFFVVVGYITILILDANEFVLVLVETLLGDNTNIEAANAMLQLAITSLSIYVFGDNLNVAKSLLVAMIKDKQRK
jgi:hypothetical protein